MADDSETLKIKMLRVTGRNNEIQWFEYRPSFMVDIVRIEWELDTMEVELDASLADFLLRMGYAAPLPQGSAPPVAPSAPPAEPKFAEPAPAPVPPPWKPAEPEVPSADPPPAPSWLKPNGG